MAAAYIETFFFHSAWLSQSLQASKVTNEVMLFAKRLLPLTSILQNQDLVMEIQIWLPKILFGKVCSLGYQI